MTLAFFGVSYTPWWLCQPVVVFWPTLCPSLSSYVIILSYHWLFNIATSFVNGQMQRESVGKAVATKFDKYHEYIIHFHEQSFSW